MNPTDLERRALLALLEHGKGVLHTLTHQELSDRLGCNWEELRPVLEHLASCGWGQGAFGQAGLTPAGVQVARGLQAAPERERQEAAEARRQFWLSTLGWLLKAVFVGVVLSLVALYLAKRWGLSR